MRTSYSPGKRAEGNARERRKKKRGASVDTYVRNYFFGAEREERLSFFFFFFPKLKKFNQNNDGKVLKQV